MPGQAQVFGQGAGEAQLGVGVDGQPGPPVGGARVAQFGRGPAEDLLEESERVFYIETAQELRTGRQAARLSQLERKLSDLLGQQAWRESGLGAPADIDALNQKITHLEQHVTDLRLQLKQKDQDLQAARAANRELMTQFNATIPAPRR